MISHQGEGGLPLGIGAAGAPRMLPPRYTFAAAFRLHCTQVRAPRRNPMGILHRLFGRRTAEVWRAETRLLHYFGYVQPPRAVQWISTSVCDLSCPHCYS